MVECSHSDCRSMQTGDEHLIITTRRPGRDVRAAAYHRIAAAVLRRAALDAQHADDRGARARSWLVRDPWAAELLEAVDAGVDRRRLASWVADLDPVSQPVLGL